MGRTSKHDSSFHFNRMPATQVRLEPPLLQGIGNTFYLIGERAEKVDVLYLAVAVNDDSHRNRIEFVVGADGINTRRQVFVRRIVLDTYREIASANTGSGIGVCWQGHFVHIQNEAFK